MDFTSSDAGSSPTYGGPQLSRQNQKPHGKNKIPHGKNKLPYGKTKAILLWSIWFCREVFGFAIMFLFLPWGFWFRCEVFGFAVRYFVFAVTFLVLPWQLWATIPYILPTVFFLLLFTTLSYKSPILWVKVTIWLWGIHSSHNRSQNKQI